MENSEKEGEVRKIQLTGKSSFSISLPKQWVTQLGLRVGDKLRVSKGEGASLVLTPFKEVTTKTKGKAVLLADPNYTPDALARMVISAYLIGYNEIEIVSRKKPINHRQREAVKEVVRRNLIGTEIIDDLPTKITLRVLIGTSELRVEDAIKRMFLLASNMQKDSIKALKLLDYNLAKRVIASDDEVDRFSLYVIRQLKSAVDNPYMLKEIGLASQRDCLGYRLVVKSLERIADHAARAAQSVLQVKEHIDSELINSLENMSEAALKVLEKASLALYTRDHKLGEEVVVEAKKVAEMEKDVLDKVLKCPITDTNLYSIRLIIEDIKRVAEYASDVGEIVINLTIEQVLAKGKQI